MAELPEDREQVRKMLRDAFTGLDTKQFVKTFTHADFVEMRIEIPLFLPEDLQLFLPRILEELMDTHTDYEVNTENEEFVLMQLNVDAYTSEETYAGWRKTFGEAVVERDRESKEHRRKSRMESFALITSDQAKAIYQWLLLARNWRCYASWSDDLEGALAYWSHRASAEQETAG